MKIIIDTLFEMSLSASVVILTVIIARLFMRSCPKIYSYLLWSIVGIRLCIPFSFESRLSIFNFFSEAESEIQNSVYLPMAEATVKESTDPYQLIGIIWISGIVVLTIYGIFTYYRLQHKLKVSFPMGDGVYAVEGLSSPFVMGFLNPVIYIPMGLDSETKSYVLMHERTHLKRRDHIIKLFAFGVLCVHWFNPFCWLAFVLMSRDMEMSCDERVLKTGEISTDYSQALLSFAVNRRFPSPGPLCFGEVSVKRRIKNILNWKKPAIYITVISVVLCITVFVVCATDSPKESTPPVTEESVIATESITADTTTADTTTADTTIADTTIADTTAADTTTIDTTTLAPETEAVTTQPYSQVPKSIGTSSVITPEMQASFDQSFKKAQQYIEESMRLDMERWYENNSTSSTTRSNNYNSPFNQPIIWDVGGSHIPR